MKKRKLLSIVCGVFLAGGAYAQEATFPDGQINIIIGSTVGGGQDAYGRLVARHLGRHLPGNPFILPQNTPGAAGRTAVRSLEIPPAAGETPVVAFTPGLIVQSIVTPDDNPIDFSRYAWLGSVGREPRVCFVWSDTGIETWEDLLESDQIILGDTGGGGNTHLTARILERLFGVNVQLVLGYPGLAEKRLALERGELDGDCGTLASIPQDWWTGDKINVVLRLQDQEMPGVDDTVPYIGDLAEGDPDKQQLLDLLNAATEIGRPFIASPDLSEDRVDMLRKAFDEMARDPDFLADAEMLRLDVTYISGPELQTTIEALYRTPPEVVEAARELMEE